MTNAATSLRGDYSPMETRIFTALMKAPEQKATSSTLLRKVYRRKEAEPFNAKIVVNKTVISLQRKLEHYREPFRLERRRLPKVRLIENQLIRNKTRITK